jgi:Cu+-exporting ATPase
VLREHGEEWITADQVQTGDRIVVKSGEWISVDGVVHAGTADADESMMTGESTAVTKRSGDRVYAGTRCLVGTLNIMVDKKHKETRLSQMIALIEAAQQSKPAIQSTVDRIAAVFVPVMLGCAVVTFAGWLLISHGPDLSETAMRHALSVLLVACPCALGLATPISILIATGSSAQKGILFKEARSLERLRQIDVVLLDKTGTLTEGLPQLVAIQAAGQRDTDVLRLTSALASMSMHPLAQAIVKAAKEQQLLIPEAASFHEHPGKGMEGDVEGNNVWISSGSGSRSYKTLYSHQRDMYRYV